MTSASRRAQYAHRPCGQQGASRTVTRCRPPRAAARVTAAELRRRRGILDHLELPRGRSGSRATRASPRTAAARSAPSARSAPESRRRSPSAGRRRPGPVRRGPARSSRSRTPVTAPVVRPDSSASRPAVRPPLLSTRSRHVRSVSPIPSSPPRARRTRHPARALSVGGDQLVDLVALRLSRHLVLLYAKILTVREILGTSPTDHKEDARCRQAPLSR